MFSPGVKKGDCHLWICDCGLGNDQTRTTCALCLTPRGEKKRISRSEEMPGTNGSPQESLEPAPITEGTPGWECTFCTHFNEESETSCLMCFNPPASASFDSVLRGDQEAPLHDNEGAKKESPRTSSKSPTKTPPKEGKEEETASSATVSKCPKRGPLYRSKSDMPNRRPSRLNKQFQSSEDPTSAMMRSVSRVQLRKLAKEKRREKLFTSMMACTTNASSAITTGSSGGSNTAPAAMRRRHNQEQNDDGRINKDGTSSKTPCERPHNYNRGRSQLTRTASAVDFLIGGPRATADGRRRYTTLVGLRKGLQPPESPKQSKGKEPTTAPSDSPGDPQPRKRSSRTLCTPEPQHTPGASADSVPSATSVTPPPRKSSISKSSPAPGSAHSSGTSLTPPAKNSAHSKGGSLGSSLKHQEDQRRQNTESRHQKKRSLASAMKGGRTFYQLSKDNTKLIANMEYIPVPEEEENKKDKGESYELYKEKPRSPRAKKGIDQEEESRNSLLKPAQKTTLLASPQLMREREAERKAWEASTGTKYEEPISSWTPYSDTYTEQNKRKNAFLTESVKGYESALKQTKEINDKKAKKNKKGATTRPRSNAKTANRATTMDWKTKSDHLLNSMQKALLELSQARHEELVLWMKAMSPEEGMHNWTDDELNSCYYPGISRSQAEAMLICGSADVDPMLRVDPERFFCPTLNDILEAESPEDAAELLRPHKTLEEDNVAILPAQEAAAIDDKYQLAESAESSDRKRNSASASLITAFEITEESKCNIGKNGLFLVRDSSMGKGCYVVSFIGKSKKFNKAGTRKMTVFHGLVRLKRFQQVEGYYFEGRIDNIRPRLEDLLRSQPRLKIPLTATHSVLRSDLQSSTRRNRVLPINWLSPELMVYIFNRLSVRELLVVAKVCRHWYDVSKDEYLWHRRYVEQFGNWVPECFLDPKEGNSSAVSGTDLPCKLKYFMEHQLINQSFGMGDLSASARTDGHTVCEPFVFGKLGSRDPILSKRLGLYLLRYSSSKANTIVVTYWKRNIHDSNFSQVQHMIYRVATPTVGYTVESQARNRSEVDVYKRLQPLVTKILKSKYVAKNPRIQLWTNDADMVLWSGNSNEPNDMMKRHHWSWYQLRRIAMNDPREAVLYITSYPRLEHLFRLSVLLSRIMPDNETVQYLALTPPVKRTGHSRESVPALLTKHMEYCSRILQSLTCNRSVQQLEVSMVGRTVAHTLSAMLSENQSIRMLHLSLVANHKRTLHTQVLKTVMEALEHNTTLDMLTLSDMKLSSLNFRDEEEDATVEGFHYSLAKNRTVTQITFVLQQTLSQLVASARIEHAAAPSRDITDTTEVLSWLPFIQETVLGGFQVAKHQATADGNHMVMLTRPGASVVRDPNNESFTFKSMLHRHTAALGGPVGF